MTFESVAAQVGVSRSWLYTQSDLRNDIIGLRSENQPGGPSIRRRDRTSVDSLHARLAVAQDRIRALAEENTAAPSACTCSWERATRVRRSPNMSIDQPVVVGSLVYPRLAGSPVIVPDRFACELGPASMISRWLSTMSSFSSGGCWSRRRGPRHSGSKSCSTVVFRKSVPPEDYGRGPRSSRRLSPSRTASTS